MFIRLLIAAAALATLPFVARADLASDFRRASGIPVTVSGRVVNENGQPLAGIKMMITPTQEGIVPIPVPKPFEGIPNACFDFAATPGFGPSVSTDANGRYSYNFTFLPEAQWNPTSPNERCSQFRNRLTSLNSRMVPSPFENPSYSFERGTVMPRPATQIPIRKTSEIPQQVPGGPLQKPLAK
jgi:hypothetical protein